MAEECPSVQAPFQKISKIVCIGAGLVGVTTSAVIALRNPDVVVTVVDVDGQRIADWKSPMLPIYEPGLGDVVAITRDACLDDCLDARGSGGQSGCANNRTHPALLPTMPPCRRRPNLFFSTDIQQAISEAELILLCVNTPAKRDPSIRQSLSMCGNGLDLGPIEEAVRQIGSYATRDQIVVEKSTVPCGTSRVITHEASDIFSTPLGLSSSPASHSSNGRPAWILSNPEFLAEGSAVSDVLNPHRVLIGSRPTPGGTAAAASLAHLYASWVPSDRIMHMDVESCEMAKLAANGLLAQRVSSINALSAICERTGADIEQVAYACGLDARIGPKMLQSGPGFGGPCLAKDTLQLASLAEHVGLSDVASYWQAVVDLNEGHKQRFAQRIVAALHHDVAGKTVAMLGFAYKKNTGDAREAPAIDVVWHLVTQKATIAIYDPATAAWPIWQALEREREPAELDTMREQVRICGSAADACDGAHAVVLMTEWDEFGNRSGGSKSDGLRGREDGVEDGDGQDQLMSKRLDWARIASSMVEPRMVLDGRNILDRVKLRGLGLTVEAIGKGRLEAPLKEGENGRLGILD
ncbi:MAG: hypothetical protein M1826_006444 [Phylliscum demangeonii]|nr:MAG: hypothetical protein M1826_006444 [Phylliscum demangeonii]